MNQTHKKGIKLRVMVFIILTSCSFVGLSIVPLILLRLVKECLGIYFALAFFSFFKNGCGLLEGFFSFLLFFSLIYAWLVYFYMGYGWIIRKIVPNKWIFSGTISALIPISLFIYFCYPRFELEVLLGSVGTAMPFACYLVVYHLKGNKKVIV